MRTHTVSVHVKRANARAKERELQAFLDGLGKDVDRPIELAKVGLPTWTRGVRVETALGGLLHTVVATERKGH